MDKLRVTTLITGIVTDSAFCADVALLFRQAVAMYQYENFNHVDALVHIFEAMHSHDLEKNYKLVRTFPMLKLFLQILGLIMASSSKSTVSIFSYEKFVALAAFTSAMSKRYVYTLRSTEVWKLSTVADTVISDIIQNNWAKNNLNWGGFINWFYDMLKK
jgi:hypothetical protein